MSKININEKLKLFNEYWTPRIVGELNGQYVKLVKLKGEFVWHDHKDEDEMFLVLKGRLVIKLRNEDVEINEGEFYIVPKGIEHKPVADEEVHILLFEPKQIAHTGDVKHELTKEKLDWI